MQDGTPTSIIGAFIMSFVALIGVVVWLIRRLVDGTIPALQATFSEQMAAERAMCREEFGQLSTAIRDNQASILEDQRMTREQMEMQRNLQTQLVKWIDNHDKAIEAAVRRGTMRRVSDGEPVNDHPRT